MTTRPLRAWLRWALFLAAALAMEVLTAAVPLWVKPVTILAGGCLLIAVGVMGSKGGRRERRKQSLPE